jgi:protein-S-isoprenylcysteine O-methyltransferase Ste14
MAPSGAGTVIISASSPERAIAVNACRSLMMTSFFEKAVRFIAIAILAFEMPVPIYWLILHSRVFFWRRHIRAAFPVAVLAAWGIIDWLLYHFRVELFRRESLPWLALVGMVLIGFDVFAFCTSEAVLGGRRIVGHSELAGSRELIARGLYARVRHPRYLGMMSGVFGACLVVALPPLWAANILWLALALLTIRAEEKELHTRLGAAYVAYAERVPALLPFRLGSRDRQVSPRREPRP